MNWAQKATKSGADHLVGLASGSTPVRMLDESHSAFRIVVGIAVVTFGLTGWLLIRMIFHDAKIPPEPNSNSSQLSAAQAKILQSQDTDNDGLSDYAELYVYGSSPYLFSSASDGVSDGEKVKEGLNPNCPKNQTCSVPTVAVGTNTDSTATTDNTNSDSSVSASFLRQALISAGAPADTVNNASDTVIYNLYQQAIGNGTINTNSSTTNANTSSANTNLNSSSSNSSTSTSVPTVSDLQSMTPAQIRSLLTQNGVDATTLNKVDDTTLNAIFQQALSTSTGS